MRKVAIITGTRAEYGLLYWVVKGVHEDPGLQLQLIVTGAHLSPEFGLTVKEIEGDGFPIAERVEMLLSSDTETAIATSMGLGMVGFAKAYDRLRPDIIVVLGDRFEILSAVAAAVPFRIPVAHIHGGESTEGAIDELFRHAITKMSHLHFPAAELYARRLRQMGEAQQRIFCFGTPGLDNIHRLSLLSRERLHGELGIPTGGKIGVVTYHPETLGKGDAEAQMSELLTAIEDFPEIYWVLTMPNADTGGRGIIRKVNDFVSRWPDRCGAFASLGRLRYLSVLKHASVMAGNSSSGLIEAPSFELPVVNIGSRQGGRVRAENVIDVPECKRVLIAEAVKKALSQGFRGAMKGIKNPYGDGNASAKIVETLRAIKLEGLNRKSFQDISR